MGLLVYEPYSKTIDPFCSRRATSYARNVPDPKTLRIMVYSCQSKNRLLCNASESVKKSKSCLKRAQARKDGSLGELWSRTSYSQTRAIQWQWSPTGQSPLLLHTLRRAEPSEANPTTLLQSFEGYPLRVDLRSEKPCLHAEVSACRQTGVTARRRGFLRRRVNSCAYCEEGLPNL